MRIPLRLRPSAFTRNLFWLLVLWLLLILSAVAQPSRAVQAANATRAIAWLEAHRDVREATGRNDGPAVWAIIRAGGGEPRMEWCGFTQCAAQKYAGLPYPDGPGAAANWFHSRQRTYYVRGHRGNADSLQVGHCVGIWHGDAVHHITRAVTLARPIRRGRPARGAWCIAGNEGRGSDAGVKLTFYPLVSMYALSNWLW